MITYAEWPAEKYANRPEKWRKVEAENRARVQLKDQYEWNSRERELLLTWTGQEDHERM